MYAISVQTCKNIQHIVDFLIEYKITLGKQFKSSNKQMMRDATKSC